MFERIKLLAYNRGLSLNELENNLNLSKNSLYALKKNTPSAERVELLADYFNVSTDYLLGRTNNPKVNNGNSEDDKDLLIAAHIRDGLSEEEKEEVMQYIEFLKSKHSN